MFGFVEWDYLKYILLVVVLWVGFGVIGIVIVVVVVNKLLVSRIVIVWCVMGCLCLGLIDYFEFGCVSL